MSNSDTTVSEPDLKALILKGIENAKGSPEMFSNLREDDIIALGKICVDRETEKYFLKHIADLTMQPCAAGRSLVHAGKKFPGFHDEDLKKWNLDDPQTAGDALPISIYEMQPGKDGNFKKIFGSLNRPLTDLVIKQNRIEQFVDDHADLLRTDGYANMFLVERESDKALFVASVYHGSGGLEVSMHELGYDGVWDGGHCRRVVVPAKTL